MTLLNKLLKYHVMCGALFCHFHESQEINKNSPCGCIQLCRLVLMLVLSSCCHQLNAIEMHGILLVLLGASKHYTGI